MEILSNKRVCPVCGHIMSKKANKCRACKDRQNYSLNNTRFKCERCNSGVYKTNLCYNCFMLKSKFSRNQLTLKYWDSKLKDFVDRIESRDGLADIQELFVDLITLYNEYSNYENVDSFSVKHQLEFMYSYLKRIRNSLK